MANNVLPSEFPLPEVQMKHMKPSSDYFGNTVTSQRINQIEVPLNDLDWLNYVNVTSLHGSALQSNGQVEFSSSTNANGRYAAISKDAVKYRSGSEIGWGFTWRFPTAGVANSYQRIGATDGTSWSNAVYIGYEGTTFGIYYRNNSVQVLAAPMSAWLDPCDGSVGSSYTSAGIPVALDITKNQLARIRAGLFGYAGFLVEILTPDGHWLKVLEYTGINADTKSIFSDFDLRIAAEVNKASSDATNLKIVSACWAGWTGVSLQRINDVITDRTLAETTRTILEGKSSSGGGTYVPVKVSPSGSLETNVANTVNVNVQEFNFTRINEKRFYDTEEVRYEIPTTSALPNGSIYIGVAPDGSLTSATVWSVVRYYFDGNGNPSRSRYRTAISWDNRAIGW